MDNPSFSASYILVDNVNLVRQRDVAAQMDSLLYEQLARRIGEPIIGKVDKLHYEFKPVAGVPAGRAVVPQRNHDTEPRTLLIQK